MKKMATTLLIAITAFSPIAQARTRTLLSDCSQLDSVRNVTVITFDDGNVRSETLLSNVVTFFCNEFGLFVYQNDNHEWFTGSVHAKESELRLNNIPDGVVSGAVSANGKQLVWAIQAGRESRLELYDVSSRQSVPLTTTSGFIRAPSWSPDDRTVAYYLGTPDALSEDGFVLMTIDTAERAEGERLTPPSLLTRLNAARTIPPLWSPDGSKLLFEARYEKSPIKTYVVDLNSNKLLPCECSSWLEDSSGCYAFSTSGDSRQGYATRPCVKKFMTDSIATDELDLLLPDNCVATSWSRDGAYIACVTTAKELLVVNTKNQHRSRLAEVNPAGHLMWITEPRR